MKDKRRGGEEREKEKEEKRKKDYEAYLGVDGGEYGSTHEQYGVGSGVVQIVAES